MKEAKFAKSLNLVVAKAGKKVGNVTRPELNVLPTINRFSLNSLATDLMQVEHGETVTLLVNQDAESFDEKFYITKGFGDDKAVVAAVNKAKGYGRTVTFNYSGIYSQMLQADVDAQELSAEGLESKGLVQASQTPQGNKSYSALRKVHFEVVEVGEQQIGDETQMVYALTNSKITSYTPKEGGESVEAQAEAAEESAEEDYNE